MAARLTTEDDCILAPAEEAGVGGDGKIIPSGVSDKPQVGGIQFDCGYLSPYFVTDPERMEVAFRNAYILITKRKSVLSRTCSHYLSRLQRVASRCS
jgi:hypothetical protein